MIAAGLDIGSRSIELVVLDGDGISLSRRLDSTFDPLAQCRRILDGVEYDRLQATGYGRGLAAESLAAGTLTEIRAHALGARRLFPDCRTILDIGGQDTKAISLGPDGRVAKFEMNDRCAAGTGKFLEIMALSLQTPLEEFGAYALRGREGIRINSMCTVFAETEATSLIARGARPEDLALALHESVIRRSLSMIKRIGLVPPLVFSGGVARNPAMVGLLHQALGVEPLAAPEPDSLGALGAALAALD